MTTIDRQTLNDALNELRRDCDYDPDGDGGGLDDLIAYKDALEDMISDLWPKAQAWEILDRALAANARGEAHGSAADVCAIGFALQERIGKRLPVETGTY